MYPRALWMVVCLLDVDRQFLLLQVDLSGLDHPYKFPLFSVQIVTNHHLLFAGSIGFRSQCQLDMHSLSSLNVALHQHG